MSRKIANRAWKHSKLSGANKLLLLALAEQADDDGFTWVGYKTLAPMVGVIERQVYRLVDNLVTKGELIVWDQQGQHGGRGYTNIYFVTTGLSKEQIAEIVRSRFDLVGDEIEAVIDKKSDTYVRLCYSKHISPATLERTRKRGGYVTLEDEIEDKKGDTYVSEGKAMGDTSVSQNEQASPPKQEKGDTYVRRLLDSSLPESPKTYESKKEKTPPKGGGKPPVANPTQQESRAMFSALAQVCGLDIKLLTEENRGALNQAEKIMRGNGYSPADLVAFGEWWYSHDWRGKQGDEPTLTQIRETWGRFRKRQQGNGPPPESIPLPDLPEHKVIWRRVESILRSSIGNAAFETNFKDAQPVERENGTFELRVKASTLEMIEARPRVRANILTALQAVKPEIHDLDFKELKL